MKEASRITVHYLPHNVCDCEGGGGGAGLRGIEQIRKYIRSNMIMHEFIQIFNIRMETYAPLSLPFGECVRMWSIRNFSKCLCFRRHVLSYSSCHVNVNGPVCAYLLTLILAFWIRKSWIHKWASSTVVRVCVHAPPQTSGTQICARMRVNERTTERLNEETWLNDRTEKNCSSTNSEQLVCRQVKRTSHFIPFYCHFQRLHIASHNMYIWSITPATTAARARTPPDVDFGVNLHNIDLCVCVQRSVLTKLMNISRVQWTCARCACVCERLALYVHMEIFWIAPNICRFIAICDTIRDFCAVSKTLFLFLGTTFDKGKISTLKNNDMPYLASNRKLMWIATDFLVGTWSSNQLMNLWMVCRNRRRVKRYRFVLRITGKNMTEISFILHFRWVSLR